MQPNPLITNATTRNLSFSANVVNVEDSVNPASSIGAEQ